MGQCACCKHPERSRLELAIAAGVSTRAIGRKYGVHYQSVHLHSRKHMTPERRAMLVAGPLKLQQLVDRAAEQGLSILDYLTMLRTSLAELYLAAAENHDRHGAALLSARLTAVLQLMGQLNGDLQRTTATITNNIAIMS